MAGLVVRVWDANREPLDDRVDVRVISSATQTTVKQALDVPGNAAITFDDLADGQIYIVQVFPKRYRPVGQLASPGHDKLAVNIYCPIHPDHASARFPTFREADPELRRVLDRSRLVIDGVERSGEALYAALSDEQKAGLFNLFVKMRKVDVEDGRSVWSYVDEIYDVRRDRVYVNVQTELCELVKKTVTDGLFNEAPDKLHEPPAGFVRSGSYKTDERRGNLQLSFFCSQGQPVSFKVDADIDNAAGIGHTFQVLRNFLTQETTHPYDIHQILVFSREVAPGYELA
jgi:hypothetical protein